MKIIVYLVAYRTRHGDTGITHHYSEKARVESLAKWLVWDKDEAVAAKVKAYLANLKAINS